MFVVFSVHRNFPLSAIWAQNESGKASKMDEKTERVENLTSNSMFDFTQIWLSDKPQSDACKFISFVTFSITTQRCDHSSIDDELHCQCSCRLSETETWLRSGKNKLKFSFPLPFHLRLMFSRFQWEFYPVEKVIECKWNGYGFRRTRQPNYTSCAVNEHTYPRAHTRANNHTFLLDVATLEKLCRFVDDNKLIYGRGKNDGAREKWCRRCRRRTKKREKRQRKKVKKKRWRKYFVVKISFIAARWIRRWRENEESTTTSSSTNILAGPNDTK